MASTIRIKHQGEEYVYPMPEGVDLSAHPDRAQDVARLLISSAGADALPTTIKHGGETYRVLRPSSVQTQEDLQAWAKSVVTPSSVHGALGEALQQGAVAAGKGMEHAAERLADPVQRAAKGESLGSALTHDVKFSWEAVTQLQGQAAAAWDQGNVWDAFRFEFATGMAAVSGVPVVGPVMEVASTPFTFVNEAVQSLATQSGHPTVAGAPVSELLGMVEVGAALAGGTVAKMKSPTPSPEVVTAATRNLGGMTRQPSSFGLTPPKAPSAEAKQYLQARVTPRSALEEALAKAPVEPEGFKNVTKAYMQAGMQRASLLLEAFKEEPPTRKKVREEGEALLARSIMRTRQMGDAALLNGQNPGWIRYAEQMTLKETISFLDARERGETFSGELKHMNEWMESLAHWSRDFDFRSVGENASALYDELRAYVHHSFDLSDPATAEKFSQFSDGYTAPAGAGAVGKHREFKFLLDALNAGFKLKSDNLALAMLNRLTLSMRGLESRKFLEELHGLGYAQMLDSKVAVRWGKKTREPSTWEKKLSQVAPAEGVDPLTEQNGFQATESDGTRWLIRSELRSAWESTYGKGLEDLMAGKKGEALYRASLDAFSRLKGAVVSAKLSLSAFHPVHIAEIAIADALHGVASGEKGVDVRLAVRAATREASEIREAYRSQYIGEMKPEHREAVNLILDGGGSVARSPEYRQLMSGKVWKDAWERHPALAVLKSPGYALDWMHDKQFGIYITDLKTTSYLNRARHLLKDRPELHQNAPQRAVELRKLWQETDDYYGMMNTDTVFINKKVKQLAHLVMVSPGWHYGFFRQVGKSTVSPLLELGRSAAEGRKPRIGEIINRSQARLLVYIGTVTAVNGVLQLALTGRAPDTVADLFAPKTGEKDSDGMDVRLKPPSQVFDFYKTSVEAEEKGALDAADRFAWSKMWFSGLGDALAGKDFMGHPLSREDDPYVGKAANYLRNLFRQTLEPMSLEQMFKEDSTPKARALGALGFPKASKVVSKSDAAREIDRAFTKKTMSREEYQWRKKIKAAASSGTPEEVDRLVEKANAAGYPIKLARPSIYEPDVVAFTNLPAASQVELLRGWDTKTAARYYPHAHTEAKQLTSTQSLVDYLETPDGEAAFASGIRPAFRRD